MNWYLLSYRYQIRYTEHIAFINYNWQGDRDAMRSIFNFPRIPAYHILNSITKFKGTLHSFASVLEIPWKYCGLYYRISHNFKPRILFNSKIQLENILFKQFLSCGANGGLQAACVKVGCIKSSLLYKGALPLYVMDVLLLLGIYNLLCLYIVHTLHTTWLG